ncbi:MAG: acetyl-CoA carboxylase biotin carboxyl carrier protein [Gemella sp.]|nr:acetyl-CoA carboxylase biotin carboxyl carrier protein [Gemella sp.]
MDLKKISEIIELFKESGLGEMSIEMKDVKLKMKSANKEIVYQESYVPTAAVAAPIAVTNQVVETPAMEVAEQGEWIRAPFVGTFYAAASEGATPFVKVGQEVKEGDVLFILEAMKVMNEIKASKSGKILEIKGINGEMVEYDQKLILIGD